jgi:predicted Rossmann fold nucleotide-binding protein DprA/Smf involved in DNA uptake
MIENENESKYPDYPGTKSDDDTTSQAAEDMSRHMGSLQSMVLGALNEDALTADQCAQRLGLPILSIRPRLSELRKTGRIRDSGERGYNHSGKKAIVWVAVIQGEQ